MYVSTNQILSIDAMSHKTINEILVGKDKIW